MNRIKELLDLRGMTQRQLADKVGVTEVTVSRYVKGIRTPRATIAQEIAKALGSDVAMVMGYDEKPLLNDDLVAGAKEGRKKLMTLNELLDVIDPHRDSESEKIQICAPDKNWEDFDEVVTSSPLLRPFGEAKVNELGAIAEDVIRVVIDWNILKEDKTNE